MPMPMPMPPLHLGVIAPATHWMRGRISPVSFVLANLCLDYELVAWGATSRPWATDPFAGRCSGVCCCDRARVFPVQGLGVGSFYGDLHPHCPRQLGPPGNAPAVANAGQPFLHGLDGAFVGCINGIHLMVHRPVSAARPEGAAPFQGKAEQTFLWRDGALVREGFTPPVALRACPNRRRDGCSRD